MALTTITVELRVDYDSDEKRQIMVEAMKQSAKHMLTTAALIADKRKPQIKMMLGDLMYGEEEIVLADDLPEGETF